MALLCITEFSTLLFDARNQLVPAPASQNIMAEQSIPIGSNSTPSAGFNASTHFVLVECDVNCCIGWGGDAVVGFHRMAQNEARYYGVRPGQSVSVIASPT